MTGPAADAHFYSEGTLLSHLLRPDPDRKGPFGYRRVRASDPAVILRRGTNRRDNSKKRAAHLSPS